MKAKPKKKTETKTKKKRIVKPKRFYVLSNSRDKLEVIDLESIVYLKIIKKPSGVVARPNPHNTKVTHHIILNNGLELKGHDERKAQGGKLCWSERLANTWAKYNS